MNPTFAYFLVGFVCLAVGFAAGRIKNSAKLAAIKNELEQVASFSTSEARALVAKIRVHL
jgi:hypothetical protein